MGFSFKGGGGGGGGWGLKLGGVAFLEEIAAAKRQLGGRHKEVAIGKCLGLKRFEHLFIDILRRLPEAFI